jgi:hypothetical protein
MAEIVLGIGSSHGPLLSTPPEQWDLRAQADRENNKHWYRGKTYDYETLLRERAPGYAAEVTLESRRERFAQCHRAMEVLGRKFREAAPDAVVIVGNDQRGSRFIAVPKSGTCSICRRTIRRGSISRSREIHRWRARLTLALRRWRTISWIPSPRRISIWRNRIPRRKRRRAGAFRTPTDSSIIRSWGTRLRPACPSF